MPFQPPPKKSDLSSLIVSLDSSKLQQTNFPLYQTIFFLIQNMIRNGALTQEEIDELNEDLSKIFAAHFLTHTDETLDFPNSRNLLAGTNITFNDAIPGQRTISASGGGASNYYDSPLTDGDPDETDLIFGNGDPIICQVPNVP